jgi:hypothetical protein
VTSGLSISTRGGSVCEVHTHFAVKECAARVRVGRRDEARRIYVGRIVYEYETAFAASELAPVSLDTTLSTGTEKE